MRRKRGWSQQVTLALWRHRALRGSVTKGRACDQRDRDVTSYWPRGMQSFGERKRPNLTQATAKEKRPRVHSTLPGEHEEGNQHSWTLIVTSLASGVWCSRVGILFASLMKWPLIGLLLDTSLSFSFSLARSLSSYVHTPRKGHWRNRSSVIYKIGRVFSADTEFVATLIMDF